MRRNWNDGQEVVFEDLTAIAPAIERGLFDRVAFELAHRKENAFFGESFKVNFATPTSVTVLAGLGFQSDVTQVSPEPQKRMLYRGVNVNQPLTTPDSSNDRIDLICVKAAVVNELSATRKYKAAVGGAVTNETMVVQKDWEAEILVVDGTPAGSPTPPSTPAGYVKLCELYMNAITGLADQSDITDYRALMPIGVETLVNTTGFQKLTVGAAIRLQQLLSEIDALIDKGFFEYSDFEDLGSDPTPPTAGRQRVYFKGGTMYKREPSPGGAIIPIGSGGGGGGGIVWTAPDGSAPIFEEEYEQDVFKFESGAAQKLVVFFKVPDSYISGRPVYMTIGQYSPSAANTQLLSIVAKLYRKDVDPITTPFKTRTSTNAAITNTVANQYRRVILDVTDGAGIIDTANIAAGDLIKVELSRGTDTDTDDVRFIPTATELRVG